MYNYPKLKNRSTERINPSEDDKIIAKKFGKEFFDGNRKHGYGGLNYDPKYWTETVRLFIDQYNLNDDSSVLDVGCGKGFMLVDFIKAIPKLWRPIITNHVFNYLYPTQFNIKTLYKRYYHDCYPILPKLEKSLYNQLKIKVDELLAII